MFVYFFNLNELRFKNISINWKKNKKEVNDKISFFFLNVLVSLLFSSAELCENFKRLSPT